MICCLDGFLNFTLENQQFLMEVCNMCESNWIVLRGTHFGYVLLILQSFSVFVISNSNYEYSNGAIIFPGESPKAVTYQLNHYQNYDEKEDHLGKIIFPSDTDVRVDNPRPRNKQVHRYPLRRPLADSMQTLSRKTMRYSSPYPQEETAGPQYERLQSQQQHSENSRRKIQKHIVRLNNLKKNDNPNSRKESSHHSEKDDSNLDKDSDNSQELIQVFLKWVQKYYPLEKSSGITKFNITNIINVASNETSYSLGTPLNDTKCPDGHKLTSDGCKKTIPGW